MSGVGLLRHRPVSGVCGRSWALRFTDTDSSVPPTALGVQQGPCQRELATFLLEVCFEPEAAGHRTVESGPFVVHRAMRGAVVGMEGVDVEVKGSGNLDVYEGGGGVGSLQHRAHFLCEFTLFAEDDDSSIVPLHGRLSDLLFRL